MTQQPNRKREKSLATQEALMDAAETLIAAKGPHYVTIKDIVKAASQKNPSVLQYHFKTMDGLLEALHLRRIAQTRLYRSKLLERALIAKRKLELRDLCELMIRPALELAKKDKQYRAYAAAFGHEIAMTGDSAFEVVSRSGGGGGSGFVIGKLLRDALPKLDEITFRARMDLAVRMCSARRAYAALSRYGGVWRHDGGACQEEPCQPSVVLGAAAAARGPKVLS